MANEFKQAEHTVQEEIPQTYQERGKAALAGRIVYAEKCTCLACTAVRELLKLLAEADDETTKLYDSYQESEDRLHQVNNELESTQRLINDLARLYNHSFL